MSVEQLDVVDVISTDRETGHVILTISDHLDWSDSVQHQTILQAKFNKYLAFVEGPNSWRDTLMRKGDLSHSRLCSNSSRICRDGNSWPEPRM